MNLPLIEFRNVNLGYGKKRIATNLSFKLNAGDFLGFVGPNGSGKTTIIRALLGIIKPQEGKIIVQSNKLEKLKIGYVPQRDSLDSILPFSVYDVVLMGRFGNLGLLKIPRKIDKEIVFEALKSVDMESHYRHTFNDLSGGQKQRTLIARALASQPEILVLDEPTNGMDLPSRTSIMEMVKKLHKESKMTIVMVSHLLSDVATYVKQIAMVERDYFQIGDTDEILTKDNLSELYKLNVHVGSYLGRTMIFAGDANE